MRPPAARRVLLAASLISVTLLLGGNLGVFRNAAEIAFSSHGFPTIETLGLAWDFQSNPTIRIKVTPNRSLSLWLESFVEDAHHSIARWKECIGLFTYRYGFNRVDRLDFEIYVEGVNASSSGLYDVTVRWVQAFSDDNVVAETLLVSEPSGRLSAATITLALMGNVRGSHRLLDDAEMRTIVAEEFGHVLGLGHADSPHDLMSGFGTLVENDLCHTTLDIYALAIIYAYLDLREFHAPQKSGISLSGTDIPYVHLEGGA